MRARSSCWLSLGTGKAFGEGVAKEEGAVTCTTCHPEGKCGPGPLDSAVWMRPFWLWGPGGPRSPALGLTRRQQAVSIHSVELNRTAVRQLLSVK